MSRYTGVRRKLRVSIGQPCMEFRVTLMGLDVGWQLANHEAGGHMPTTTLPSRRTEIVQLGVSTSSRIANAWPNSRHMNQIFTRAMEREHRMAEPQITRRRTRLEDDPLMRYYVEQPDVMVYQLKVFGSNGAGPLHGAAPSHGGVDPSHDATPTEDETAGYIDDPRLWTQLDRWGEAEDAKNDMVV